MTSLDDVVAVSSAYLEALGPPPHAVTRLADRRPRYLPQASQPEVCRVAGRDKAIGAVCDRFYRDLGFVEGEAVCPFGVQLYFHRVKVSQHSVCLYQHFGTQLQLGAAKDLPRKSKKLVKQSLASRREFNSGAEGRARFESAKGLLATLLTGRVAESIRALSHHLLTPLQGAIADVDALEQAEAKPHDIVERLGRNLEQVDTAAKQIQLLLAEEVDIVPARIRKVRVVRTVTDLVSANTAEALRRDIAIEHVISSNSDYVEAVPDQFEVVISNLLSNAVKYSFSGRTVRVSYSEEGDRLLVRFVNYGCGILPDELQAGKIFELGYRGRLSGDRGRSGTGTGLYIADKIANAHGAEIRVTSRPTGPETDPNNRVHENKVELVWPVYSPLRG